MKSIVLIMMFLYSFLSLGQDLILEGQLIDTTSNSPIPNASVTLSDSLFKTTCQTNTDGYFQIRNLITGKYLIEIEFLSLKKYAEYISIGSENRNIGKIFMRPNDINIKEVNIIGQVVPVSQKGDTTEMSAQSYKVNVDADALDLVKKMPGITVEDGKIKAHGEELKKVLLDGKDFFGEDVALSLQNIPSDMIDKVQVYSKLSDQSEFIGFDDGNSEKVMNIITRPDRKKGQNGKFTAGYGPDNHYLLSGRWNISTKNSNLTILGGSNNTNQQNFTMQDMFQSMGGGPGGGIPGGDRSGFIGGMSGLNTMHSAGLNYSGALGSKIKISNSYFFNMQGNETIEKTNKEFFGNFDPMSQVRFEEDNQLSNYKNLNHRINTRVEIKLDSLNSITYRQSFSFQNKDQNSSLNSSNYNDFNNPLMKTVSENQNNSNGYNFSGNFVVRHKFIKNGRTISLGLQYSSNNQNLNNLSLSNTQSFTGDVSLNQNQVSYPIGNSYSANIMYTEPISRNMLILVSYNAGKSPSTANKFVYNETFDPHQRLDSLSNDLESDYFTQRAGLSLLIQKGKDLNASVGLELQNADLTGQQNFPYTNDLNKSFRNILPNARLRYKLSKKTNIMLAYRASTQAPTVSQLQPVQNISSSKSFYLGNPGLIPSYDHSLMTNFRYANPQKFINFGFNLFGDYTLDPIGNKTEIVRKDTTIYGQHLVGNGELISLTNLDNSWNIRGFVNYGFMLKPIRCNISLMAGTGYTTIPGIINNRKGTTKSTDFMEGVVIASNISQYIDFTASYRGNYTMSGNDIDQNLNSQYWRHTIVLTSTLSGRGGLVLSNTISEQIIRGLGNGYNPDYLIWNCSLGKKIFKNKAGQISVQVNDVLDQGKDVSRSVTDYYIADSSTSTLGRCSLITFTYTLRAYSNKGNPQYRFGPPDGFDGPPPGGPPPGGPPPGGMID